jgi:bifunctional DNA-binding transcriptional regulator/antitoxin component of YhaV-PrlF toxin-antitoxin module
MGVFVNIDKAGRLVLPKRIRESVNTSCFDVSVEGESRIVFTPVKSAKEMFGSMPDLDVEGFRKEHAKER